MFNKEDYKMTGMALLYHVTESKRIAKTKSQLYRIPLLWEPALKELRDVITRETNSMMFQVNHGGLSQEDNEHIIQLIERMTKFPDTLSYHIIEENGTVLILSTDKYLDRALFYGTRILPILKPIKIVSEHIGKAIGANSPVFISQAFETNKKIDHETDQEYTQNTKQTNPK